ncbi:MAG: hypothetical protein R3D97_09260 [Paracoccaceae bacterium]
MKLIDVQHPWFRPLWRRVFVAGVTLGWAVLEFAMGGPFWGMLFGSLGVYLLHQFFIAFDPREDAEK